MEQAQQETQRQDNKPIHETQAAQAMRILEFFLVALDECHDYQRFRDRARRFLSTIEW